MYRRATRSSPSKEGDPGEMAPHLARDEEFPFVGQGTSLGTTTDSPPPTTTTTPNSAAEFDSNFAVGDADQDYYASTSNVAPNNWNIEGVASLDDKGVRHMNAFYAVLKEWIGKKEYTTKLMMKAEYDKIVNFLLGVKEGTTDCCEEKKSGNASAYRWLQKYHLFTFRSESAVLVLRPDNKKEGPVNVTAMALKDLARPTYAERMFADLRNNHKCKNNQHAENHGKKSNVS